MRHILLLLAALQFLCVETFIKRKKSKSFSPPQTKFSPLKCFIFIPQQWESHNLLFDHLQNCKTGILHLLMLSSKSVASPPLPPQEPDNFFCPIACVIINLANILKTQHGLVLMSLFIQTSVQTNFKLFKLTKKVAFYCKNVMWMLWGDSVDKKEIESLKVKISRTDAKIS